jgi:hypothetical protein
MSNFEQVVDTLCFYLYCEAEEAKAKGVSLLSELDITNPSSEWAVKVAAIKSRLDTIKDIERLVHKAYEDFEEETLQGFDLVGKHRPDPEDNGVPF